MSHTIQIFQDKAVYQPKIEKPSKLPRQSLSSGKVFDGHSFGGVRLHIMPTVGLRRAHSCMFLWVSPSEFNWGCLLFLWECVNSLNSKALFYSVPNSVLQIYCGNCHFHLILLNMIQKKHDDKTSYPGFRTTSSNQRFLP